MSRGAGPGACDSQGHATPAGVRHDIMITVGRVGSGARKCAYIYIDGWKLAHRKHATLQSAYIVKKGRRTFETALLGSENHFSCRWNALGILAFYGEKGKM